MSFRVSLLASLLVFTACSTSEPGTNNPPGSGMGGRAGSAGGTGGRGGSTGTGTGGASASGGSGAGGASVSGGSSGTTTGGQSGGGGSGGGAGGGLGSGGARADAGAGGRPVDAGGEVSGAGWAGFAGIEDLSTVKPSPGCGLDPGQALGEWVRLTVQIQPKPVRGTGNRVYFIKLPANYDRMKPYRLVFVVPGCGSQGNTTGYDFTAPAGTEGVVQIGMNADPMAFSYPGCFDDFRTDSVEPQFFETLLDIASKKLCFDQHRVYFVGHSSGSFVSNMMGCKYGGTKVRAIAPSSGGLATDAMGANMAAPCSDAAPTAGIWSHNEDDTGNRISWTIGAINRALKVNKCQGTYETSPRVPYPGHADCQRFSTCPAEFPVVICHPRTGGHEGNRTVQPARAWEFFKALP